MTTLITQSDVPPKAHLQQNLEKCDKTHSMSDENHPLLAHIPRTVEDIEAQRLLRKEQEQLYGIAFEHFLEGPSSGRPLDEMIAEYHTPIRASLFRAWIYRDENRKKAWLTAKALGAEAIEDEMVRIADGSNSPMETEARTKLRLDTRWRLMAVNNRGRYGDVKQIETRSTTVDASTLSSSELRQRILQSLGLSPEMSTIFDNEA
jgi:hypothetical protein